MSEQTTNGTIVAIRQPLSIVHAYSMPDENGRPQNMSFNPATPDGARKLIQATLGEVPLLETLAKEYLMITDYFSHAASSIDQKDGRVSEFNRIVVFDTTGQAFSCGSMGVAKSLSVLTIARGPAPWNPPAKVKVITRRLANGNNWMILEPDFADLAAAMNAVGKSATTEPEKDRGK